MDSRLMTRRSSGGDVFFHGRLSSMMSYEKAMALASDGTDLR